MQDSAPGGALASYGVQAVALSPAVLGRWTLSAVREAFNWFLAPTC